VTGLVQGGGDMLADVPRSGDCDSHGGGN
jgi:hypothetical protein